MSIDKKQMIKSFNAAVDHYDQAAALQRIVANKLIIYCKQFSKNPHNILDLGSGTGLLSQQLRYHFKNSQLTCVDIAWKMLQACHMRWKEPFPPQFICSDAETLALQPNTFHLIASNLTLQWAQSLKSTLSLLQQTITPKGSLIFSTLGPQTLRECRQCWEKIDDYVHVNRFTPLEDINCLLEEIGFKVEKIVIENRIQYFDKIEQLLQSLKKLGAHNVNEGRPKGLMGKQKWKLFCDYYDRYKNAENQFPARYEVFYFICQKV